MTLLDEARVITLQVIIPPDGMAAFINWQASFNVKLAAFPGFVSLEILAPGDKGPPNWCIVQRFINSVQAEAWLQSSELKALKEELKSLAVNRQFQEFISPESSFQEGITEVFITRVVPEKEAEYREWMAKIHQVEAQFPGFKGAYVQSPKQGSGHHWITLLQFDKPENLDRWLSSSERQEVLKQSTSLISSLESHRVISPFAGWFSAFSKKIGEAPPVWKQTMLILLVLFPIVMLEFKFLNPLTRGLDVSLGTFIGNTLSVILIAWPAMPIAIRFLGWWLVPTGENKSQITFWGLLLVLGLYLIEILVFWSFV